VNAQMLFKKKKKCFGSGFTKNVFHVIISNVNV